MLGKYDELNLRHLKPGVLYLKAKVALTAENKEETYQTLFEALILSDEMGARREAWTICSVLSQLEAERGNKSTAAQLRERACSDAAFIADHAGAPELRQIFLSRPDLQLIVGA